MNARRTAPGLFALALALAAAAADSAHAADFINLDFEQAQAPPLQPPAAALLDWDLAAPGWQHSTGADTGGVYYGATHVGNTQWFALVSAQSLPFWLQSGTYSFAFSSGYAAPSGPGSPFVQATLSQTGTVPADARTLQLRQAGPLAVFLGDTRIPLQHVGDGLFAGDITAYAGQMLELRLVNLSTQQGPAVVVDDLLFSPLALVPDAPPLATLGAGLAGLAAWMLRRRTHTTPARKAPTENITP
jgi:hypothetical protein